MPSGLQSYDADLIHAALSLEQASLASGRPPEFEDTWARIGWRPFPRQQAVIDAVLAGHYAILAGGAAGGGKSALGRNLAIALCLKHPGMRVGIFRRTYPELHRTHELPISQLPTSFGKYYFDPHEYRFLNGSILELGSVERNADLIGYQSAEYGALIFDEATQFTWEQICFLNARVRSPDPTTPKFILLLTNPGGESHNEIKTTFVDTADPETPFQARIGESDFPAIFVPFRLEDNPALDLNDPDYRKRIMAMPEYLRRAWLFGSWDIQLGGFFDEWFAEKHVIRPFDLPRSWPRWRALDYGFAAPFCCLWFARSNDGVIYVYRELYEKKIIDRDQARLVLELSKNDPPIRFTAADPSIYSKQPNGKSIGQAYLDAGLRTIPANNDRKSGWQRLRGYLHWDEDNEPRLKVFSTCKNLIRTMPVQQFSKYVTEDLDTHGEDHPADTLRYGVMGGSIRSRGVRVIDFEVTAG
jgi:hypothetical protein